MRIALVQQHASADRSDNVSRGLAAMERAARDGANLIAFAELAFEPFHPQRPASSRVKDLAGEMHVDDHGLVITNSVELK